MLRLLQLTHAESCVCRLALTDSSVKGGDLSSARYPSASKSCLIAFYIFWNTGASLFCVSSEPETECYNSRGISYRGVVGTTVSGARCLPWNSDLLYNELHVGTVVTSRLRGLGNHSFCRCVPIPPTSYHLL